jgi:hypothetical protein
MRLLLALVALLVAACSSSDSGGASSTGGAGGGGNAGGTGGSGVTTGPGCKVAGDCPCYSCVCPDGTTATSRACFEESCYGGGLACGLVCTPSIGAVATLDASGAACAGGPAGSGGAGGGATGGGGTGGGGTVVPGQCTSQTNPFNPAMIDCAKACAFFGMHPSDACANPYAMDAKMCQQACQTTKATSPYVDALWGCAASTATCDAWVACLDQKCG